jgi:FkbM family methyltransferase
MDLDLDSTVDRLVYYTGFYRPWARHYYDQLLRAGYHVVDVGANIGIYTLWASLRVGPTGSVHAFEPAPEPYAQLQRNVELSGASNVRTIRAAVAYVEDVSKLYIKDSAAPNRGQASLTPHPYLPKHVDVPCVRLDSEVSSGKTPPPDVVKIDAQGAELDVIRGAASCIRAHHPHLMVRLYAPDAPATNDRPVIAQQLLLDHGYELMEIIGGYECLVRHERTRLLRVRDPHPARDATFVAVHPSRRSSALGLLSELSSR